jgi:hypothetical protein
MMELFANAKMMMMCIAVVAVVVFVSMLVDLVAGLYKASLRGDVRRSEALKRTGYKFALYEGTILIAAGVDFLIHLAKFPLWFGWDMVYGIPLVTIALGIFWCTVEFLSVREKADKKTHAEMNKTIQLATEVAKILQAIKDGKTIEIKDIEPLDMQDM